MPRAERGTTARRCLLTTLAAVIAASLLLPGPVRATDGDNGRDRSGWFMLMLQQNSERLGLDEAKLREIDAVASQDREAARALRERKHEARRTMRDLLTTPSPDEAAVMRQADVLGNLDTELRKLHLRTMIRVRALLTPAQLAEISKLREERRSERAERRSERRRRSHQ